MRQGENNMIVCNRQNVLQSRVNPLAPVYPLAFGAMPVTTRIISFLRVPAFLAHVYMKATLRSAAIHDGGHDLMLHLSHTVFGTMFFTIEPENIGNFVFRVAVGKQIFHLPIIFHNRLKLTSVPA